MVAGGDTYAFDPGDFRGKEGPSPTGSIRPISVMSRSATERSWAPTSPPQPARTGFTRRQRASCMDAPNARGLGQSALGEHCVDEARRLGFRAMHILSSPPTNPPCGSGAACSRSRDAAAFRLFRKGMSMLRHVSLALGPDAMFERHCGTRQRCVPPGGEWAHDRARLPRHGG